MNRVTDDRHLELEYYRVKLEYKVQTKVQAKETVKTLNAAYQALVDKWCGNKPKRMKVRRGDK